MKAIIIDEKQFVELVEKLRLQKSELIVNGRNFLEHKPDGMTQAHWEGLIQDVHRSFNYLFVQWAQEQGASCVRS